MSEVKEKFEIFQNEEFGVIRTIFVEGEAMFCLSDVAKALGYANPAKAVITHCKGVTVLGTPTENQWGTTVMQPMKYGKESEVYRLIMRSKNPKAEVFQDWVCGDILPTIRKKGMYATDVTIDKMIADPDFAISLLTNLKEEREARRLAEEKKAMLEEKVETDAPKVTFAETIMGSESAISIDELAKLITQEMEKRGIKFSIGQNNLFKWLRVNGYLGTTGAYYNIPNQRYVEAGYFEVRKGMRLGKGGEVIETSTPKVKTKGQQYFINKFINANYI